MTGRARALGWRAGTSAGTWQDHIADKDVALRCLRWFDDGDPVWELTFGYTGPPPLHGPLPEPLPGLLSGQDPDAPTLDSVADELDLGPDPDPGLLNDVFTEYTDGFADGYQDHICNAALAVVAAWVDDRLTTDAPISRVERDTAVAYVELVKHLEDQQDIRPRDQLARRLAALLPTAALHDD